MKNRYKIESDIIIGSDNGYTATEVYLTDDNLQCLNSDGVPQYKIDKGKHVLRTKEEIESDPIFIDKYNEAIKQKLNDIDLKSIRSMREYIASKSDAPQFIKDHEAEAKTERDKMK